MRQPPSSSDPETRRFLALRPPVPTAEALFLSSRKSSSEGQLGEASALWSHCPSHFPDGAQRKPGIGNALSPPTQPPQLEHDPLLPADRATAWMGPASDACDLTASHHHQLQSHGCVLDAHQWPLQGSISSTLITGCRMANYRTKTTLGLGRDMGMHQSPCVTFAPGLSACRV